MNCSGWQANLRNMKASPAMRRLLLTKTLHPLCRRCLFGWPESNKHILEVSKKNTNHAKFIKFAIRLWAMEYGIFAERK
jgi:hypothetical protein